MPPPAISDDDLLTFEALQKSPYMNNQVYQLHCCSCWRAQLLRGHQFPPLVNLPDVTVGLTLACLGHVLVQLATLFISLWLLSCHQTLYSPILAGISTAIACFPLFLSCFFVHAIIIIIICRCCGHIAPNWRQIELDPERGFEVRPEELIDWLCK